VHLESPLQGKKSGGKVFCPLGWARESNKKKDSALRVRGGWAQSAQQRDMRHGEHMVGQRGGKREREVVIVKGEGRV